MVQIPDQKLKELLVKDNLVKPEDFDSMLGEANRLGQNITDVLISRGVMSEKYFISLLSSYYGVAQTTLDPKNLDEGTVKLIPEDIARKRRVIAFGKNNDGSYNVAMENPSDLEAIEFLTNFLKANIIPYLATSDDLNKGFSVYSRAFTKDFKKIIEENIKASLKSTNKDIKDAAADVPIVSLVDNVISYASSLGASDIHIESLEDSILIRYRIDGILHEIMRVPKEVHAALIARIKLLSALKLDEHGKPQDGRFRYKIVRDFVDIRVSIMPTFHGEKAVLRLLPSTQKPMSLLELGIHPNDVPTIQENTKRTYGMVLVCGPTGSGKTTTLYSILSLLNKPEVNIVTIEDPIEYQVKYVNQTQINPQAGVTFASGLRSILRQDPNIILVGEVRDFDTAEISVNAALTGHLVLSSLHTNDAPTAIPRLIDMKIVPFLVSAVLNTVVSQRLVRKICQSCIYSYEPEQKILATLKKQLKEIDPNSSQEVPKVLFRGKGCQSCGDTGYKGRMGIFEVLNVGEEIRNFITSKEFSLDGLKKLARQQGMVSMFEDGLRKAQLGITTLEEVLRVIRE